MNKLTFLIVIILAIKLNISIAQETFQVLFKNSLNERVHSLIEDDNGNVVAVGVGNVFDAWRNTFQGRIWKINSAGDSLSLTINFNDTTANYCHIEQLPNGNYFIVGTLYLPPDYNRTQIVFLELNKNFEKVRQKSFQIGTWNYIWLDLVKKFKGEYFLLGGLSNDLGQKTPFIVKLDSNWDTICNKVYNGSVGNFEDCIFSPDSSQLWVFPNGLKINPFSPASFYIFDTTLNYISQKSFPIILNPVTVDIELAYGHNKTVRWFNDEHFLIGCNHIRTFNHQQDLEEDIGFSFQDTALSPAPVQYIGATDTNDYASFYRGTFDFKNSDSIFFTGFKNQISDFWPMQPSWIYFGLLNSNLEPQYTNFYGGDAYYRADCMKCTSDGGCIIATQRYDYLTQNSENDVMFLKLNNQGLITSRKEPDICPNAVFFVYPNPSNDYFTIGLSIARAHLRVFSIDGELFFESEIFKDDNKVITTEWPLGTYLIQVISPDNKTYNKKIVKTR